MIKNNSYIQSKIKIIVLFLLSAIKPIGNL